MRKIIATIAAVSVAGLIGNAVAADNDFELGGHVSAGWGGQMFGSNASSASIGAAGANALLGAGATQYGSVGEFTNNNVVPGTTSQKKLVFFVDEVELNMSKSFGENIRARADVSFGRAASGLKGGGLNVEQAYTTVNIPVGNGMEFLVGRFDAPIGFETVDRGGNTLFSHGAIFTHLRPTSLTGAKFYYPFSDMVDVHFYVVNNLRDALGTVVNDSALPSFGTRIGVNWGDEGKKSTFGMSFAGGPEARPATGGKMGRWSYLGDFDWNVWFNDAFALGGEAIFRQDGAGVGATKALYFAGQLNLNYVFNDSWDGTLRYGYANSNKVAADSLTGGANLLTGSGTKAQVHELTLGGQYHIADGAKLQLEGRYDMVKNTGLATGSVYGGAMNFVYNF